MIGPIGNIDRNRTMVTAQGSRPRGESARGNSSSRTSESLALPMASDDLVSYEKELEGFD